MAKTYPSEPPHPGELIERVLMRNRQLTFQQLAAATGIKPALLAKVINGEEPITQDLAEHFRADFGKVADSLVNVQFLHDFWHDHHRLPTREERIGPQHEQSMGM